MARRRMISETMLSDERFNQISIGAQNIFLRMLAVSDDCGVVPAGTYRLNVLINTPPKLQKRVQEIVDEIVAAGMGHRFEYASEPFFAFKPDSFQDYQSYILAKATKSEYLRISKDDFLGISKNFSESPDRVGDSASRTVESREYKAISIKQQAESKEQKEERPISLDVVQELWKERSYPTNEASKFWNYYSANGWRVGKNPMKDWKAAAAGWVMRSKEFGGPRQETREEKIKRIAEAIK